MSQPEIYKLIFEHANDLIVLMDTKLRVVDVNQAACKAFGVEEEDLIGLDTYKIIPQAQSEQLEYRSGEVLSDRKLLNDSTVYKVEINGVIKELEARSAPIKQDGELKGIVSIFRDVTEREQYRRELERTKEELENLWDHAPVGIVYFDREMKLLRLNAAAEEIINSTSEEVCGHHCYDVIGQYRDSSHKKGRERICDWCTAVDALELGRPTAMEREFNKRWLRIVTAPVRGSEGEIIGGMEIIQDVTREKKLMERLRESEAKYRALIHNLPDAVFIVDVNGEIVDLNQKAERLTGYSKEEIVGKHFSSLHPPEEAERYTEEFERKAQKCREERKPITISTLKDGTQLNVAHKGGKRIPVEISASFLEIEGRHVFQGVFRDITKRKEMEEAMVQAEKLSSLSMLTAGLAHELNNPLNNIAISSQLLREDIRWGLQPREEDVDDIVDQVDKASSTVNSLLEFSRLDSSGWESEDIKKLVDETLGLASYILKSKKIEVAVDVPSMKMRCNPSQMQQVFFNIIVNSAQAIREGGRLKVSARERDKNIEFLFQDDGPGIPEENRDKIFEPFFTTKEGEGTGLGLAVAQSIVKRHQGDIKVHSEENEGTSFTVIIPHVE